MMVTLRFYVSEVTKRGKGSAGNATVKLTPAYNNGSGNEAWAIATPSGAIELQVNNASAIETFEQWRADGVDLHITMEPVPAER